MVGAQDGKSERTRWGRRFAEGWEGIATILGKHASTVRVYAKRSKDPLPVQRDKLSGRVWVYLDDLDDWAFRNGLGRAMEPAES